MILHTLTGLILTIACAGIIALIFAAMLAPDRGDDAARDESETLSGAGGGDFTHIGRGK